MSVGRAQQVLFRAALPAAVVVSEIGSLPELQVVAPAAVERPRAIARACRLRGLTRSRPLERLKEIATEGGQTWVVMCVTAGCARARLGMGGGR